MKPYPAVMREKRRYCNFKIVSDASVSGQQVAHALRNAVVQHIGATGAASAGFLVMEFDEESQKGILRCTNKELERVRSSLAMVTEIDSKRALVHITDVTGTIKKAKKEKKEVM